MIAAIEIMMVIMMGGYSDQTTSSGMNRMDGWAVPQPVMETSPCFLKDLRKSSSLTARFASPFSLTIIPCSYVYSTQQWFF